jgi:hypothetical protein
MRSIAALDAQVQAEPAQTSAGLASSVSGSFGRSNAPLGLGFSGKVD